VTSGSNVLETGLKAARDPERDWWLRALAVLQSPGPVFAALRDDSREAVEARQEPITALMLLAGIALCLTAMVAGTLLDGSAADGVVFAVLVFLYGGFLGLVAYWLGGGAVAAGVRGAGAEGTYRRARHVVAFASAPLVLSLLFVWPLALALYGLDLFRSGGADAGVGGDLVLVAVLAFAAWSLGLVLVGLRTTYRLGWRRVVLAFAFTALAFAALSVVSNAFFGGLGGGG